MSKAYVCSLRRQLAGSWTIWRPFGFNPNLDYARQELVNVFGSHLHKEDRGEAMEAEWTALIEKAKTLEVGEILECDERQWRIELDT